MGKDRLDAGRGRRAEGVKPGQRGKGSKTPAKSKAVKTAGRGRGKGPFYAVLAMIAAVAVVFIVYQATRPKAQAVAVDPNTPLPTAEGYVLGNANAPLQVLEFADFECPACAQFATITEPDVRSRLIETGQISFRFLDFPLAIHPNSWAASMAAACANEQGKFWPMHDQIFDTQDRWSAQASRRPRGIFRGLAQSIGLNVSQWETCFDSQKYRLNIAANQKEGERRLVQSTPTFVIGSKMIPEVLSYDRFKAYVDSAIAALPPTAPRDSGKKTTVPSR